jgi:hypothetical protein
MEVWGPCLSDLKKLEFIETIYVPNKEMARNGTGFMCRVSYDRN